MERRGPKSLSTRWSWVTLQELGLLKQWVGMTHTHTFPSNWTTTNKIFHFKHSKRPHQLLWRADRTWFMFGEHELFLCPEPENFHILPLIRHHHLYFWFFISPEKFNHWRGGWNTVEWSCVQDFYYYHYYSCYYLITCIFQMFPFDKHWHTALLSAASSNICLNIFLCLHHVTSQHVFVSSLPSSFSTQVLPVSGLELMVIGKRCL